VDELIYVVRCIFCKSEHRSPWFDVLEEEILDCRDRAPEWQKGRLERWEDPAIKPVTVEMVASLNVDAGSGQVCQEQAA
jgi:hypothetical protein